MTAIKMSQAEVGCAHAHDAIGLSELGHGNQSTPVNWSQSSVTDEHRTMLGEGGGWGRDPAARPWDHTSDGLQLISEGQLHLSFGKFQTLTVGAMVNYRWSITRLINCKMTSCAAFSGQWCELFVRSANTSGALHFYLLIFQRVRISQQATYSQVFTMWDVFLSVQQLRLKSQHSYYQLCKHDSLNKTHASYRIHLLFDFVLSRTCIFKFKVFISSKVLYFRELKYILRFLFHFVTDIVSVMTVRHEVFTAFRCRTH